MRLPSLVLVALTLSIARPASAEWREYLWHHSQRVQLARQPQNARVIARTRSGLFAQKLDPTNPNDPRTFKQRYYVNTTLAQGPDSPVIYYICGEAECTAEDFAGEAMDMASRYHAVLVSLEHRYYGQSQPFADLSTDHMKYLRIEYALADLARFQDYARERLGLRGKWIAVGGSYPGALSAYYRELFPDHVVGALASSAPVEARIAFEDYDHSNFLSVDAQCAAAIQSVTRTIEAGLQDPAETQALYKLFDLPPDLIQDKRDFLYIVADAVSLYVQYGMKDKLCATMAGSSSPIPTLAQLTKDGFATMGMKVADDSFERLLSTDVNMYNKGIGSRQWFYQSCAQWGFFQVAYHDPAQSLRSAAIDLPFHYAMCRAAFGTPPVGDVGPHNRRYLAPLMDANLTSNIYFTNGSQDPWNTLSISHERGNAVNPRLTEFMIQGGSHCSDLASRLQTPPAVQSRELFAQLIAKWL